MEQTDLVLLCSKTYRLDEKFVDTAENQLLKVNPRNQRVAVKISNISSSCEQIEDTTLLFLYLKGVQKISK